MSLLAQLSALRGRYLWRSFQAMTEHPEEVQQQLLRRLLSTNRDTAFGKAHGFASMISEQDYRQGVPVADYEKRPRNSTGSMTRSHATSAGSVCWRGDSSSAACVSCSAPTVAWKKSGTSTPNWSACIPSAPRKSTSQSLAY